ncbi:MAG: hypothetical protein ACRDTM_17295, partial [Micromonosporaceae bacterium]
MTEHTWPPDYAELHRLAAEAEKLAQSDDRTGLRRLAREVNIQFAVHGLHRWSSDPELEQIVDTLDAAYDHAFPVRDRTDPYDAMDVPWATESRIALLNVLLTGDPRGFSPPLEPLAEQALGERDVPRLRRLAETPVGGLSRETLVRILDPLYAERALDAEVIEAVFTNDRWIGYPIRGRDTSDNVVAEPAACAGFVHD